jgi:hypothetical protein
MLERADFDNASVVDQDIYLAKAIEDLPDSRLNLFGIEKIAFNRENFATARNKISLCTCQLIGIARNESNVAAARANMSREHESESARPAGDKDNFVVQRIACGANEARDYPGDE